MNRSLQIVMTSRFKIPTLNQTAMVDITPKVQEAVARRGIGEGLCHVFVPHTTAGIMINECADSDVVADLTAALEAIVPRLPFRHREGNSSAHLKAALIGSGVTIPVEDGRLSLGTWQGIFLCEFDGPRQRTVLVTMIAGRSGQL